MRHGRRKQARRTLQFLDRCCCNASTSNSSKKSPTYRILVDGTFVVAVVRHGLPLADRLFPLLGGSSSNSSSNSSSTNNIQSTIHRYAILESSVAELQKLADKFANQQPEKADLMQRALAWAQDYCDTIVVDDNETGVDQDDQFYHGLGDASRDMLIALASTNRAATSPVVATNNNKNPATATAPSDRCFYFCASQDEELLDRVRNVPFTVIPVIRLARGSVLLLEQPSQRALQWAQSRETRKFHGRNNNTNTEEQKWVSLVKQQEQSEKKQQGRNFSTTTGENKYLQRKRKAKGPNPLSCKKKRDGDSRKKQKKAS